MLKVGLQFGMNISACKLSSPADASCAILISELQLEINQTLGKYCEFCDLDVEA